MSTDEKLNVTLEWVGDVPYQLKVGVEVVWRNPGVLVDIQNIAEKTVTLPRVRAIKFARLVLAGLQAERFISIGEELKAQTEALLAKEESFKQKVLEFYAARMLDDAKCQAHKPPNCPRCDVCESEHCDGCDVAENCLDGSCTNCPEKDGCYAIASEDPFDPDDDDDFDEDDDEDWGDVDFFESDTNEEDA